MWVGFFRKKLPIAEPLWRHRCSGSIVLACLKNEPSATFFIEEKKKKEGSRSKEVRWVSLSPPRLQNISISCLRNR